MQRAEHNGAFAFDPVCTEQMIPMLYLYLQKVTPPWIVIMRAEYQLLDETSALVVSYGE